MEFEWDEAKREANLIKHQIDFVDAQILFDGRPVLTVSSQREDEVRFVSTGLIYDRFATVVWVMRDDNIRLISARRSRDGEKRAYRALHGGRN